MIVSQDGEGLEVVSDGWSAFAHSATKVKVRVNKPRGMVGCQRGVSQSHNTQLSDSKVFRCCLV
jgi:hypothetical protein